MAALRCLPRWPYAGFPLQLSLYAGNHTVNKTLHLDEATMPSELNIIGPVDGMATIIGPADAPIFDIGRAGTKRLHLERLTIRGRLVINATDMIGSTGMILNRDTCTIMQCTFQGYISAGDRPWFGGAIHLLAGQLSIRESRFEGLNATAGGAIALSGGHQATLLASATQFVNNRAARGGAIYADVGWVEFEACELTANVAEAQGGALFANDAVILMTSRTQLKKNRAHDGGGRTAYTTFKATLQYILPAPDAHWIPNSVLCEVRYRQCPNFTSCVLVPVDDVQQPCLNRYASFSRLLTRTFTTLLPGAIDAEYPFSCPPGYWGGSRTLPLPEEQATHYCAGPCPAGKWCGEATVSPVECRAPTYCPQGSAAETLCPGGTFSNQSGATSQATCNVCLAGASCVPGSKNPVACFPGSYASSEGRVSCDICPAGKFQRNLGATSCELCNPGLYCPVGSPAGTPCPPGTFSAQRGLASVFGCTRTRPGYAARAGSTHPDPCRAGSFSDANGTAQCAQCAAGSYQDDPLGTACKLCTVGSFCTIGATYPTPCPGGTAGSELGSTSQSACAVCPNGTACAAGSSVATSCAPGSYAPMEGQSRCWSCPSGKFQSETRGTACSVCEAGRFCPEGSSAELVCFAGTYSESTGLQAAEQCKDCPSGSFCGAGATNHTACRPGSYANATRTSLCWPCEHKHR